ERTRRMPKIPKPQYKRVEQIKNAVPLERGKILERRPKRELLPKLSLDISLRPEEQTALREMARFRVLATRDIAETIYSANRSSQMRYDLRFLEERGLISVNSVNARRDGRGGRVERIEVVTLTKAGRD